MIRTKIFASVVCVVLSLTFSLAGQAAYNEAPELKELVAQGKLPPVEERISEEPLVLEPIDSVGKYGGVLKSASLGIHAGGPDPRSTREQAWFAVDPRTSEIVPNAAKSWELSEDMKTLTLHLRKGMKWSDGAPFTTEDVMFWYEDIMLNEELNPAVQSQWRPGEETMKITAVDEYTFQLQFAVPYPAVVGLLAADYNDVGLHYPKHFLQKWHIKYNPEANDLAKEEGFENWWQVFKKHSAIVEPEQDPDRPDINPWVLKEITVKGDKIFVRNPYYWKVDTEGNQLPYVDQLHRIVAKSTEIMDLKMMSGELNYAGCKLSFSDYPLYKEGEEKGNYRAVLMNGDVRTNQGMSFNLWHKDPVMREIFNDVRFRQALSLGMNRDRINEVLYFGQATPWAATVSMRCSFMEEQWGTYYTEYDLDRANALLDEMGLEWDQNHEYRLRPDGSQLAINLEYVDLGSGWGERLEMKTSDWRKLGINVALKEIERALYITRLNALELDFAIWNYEAEETDLRYSKSYFLRGVYGSSPWDLWHRTKGAKGEEPPEDVKALFNTVEKWAASLPGSDQYMQSGKEILQKHAENLWSLGDLVDGPQPAVFVKSLRNNTPAEGGPLIWPGQRFWKLYMPDQWYFE